MIRFNIKKFSILGDTVKGASIGATAGGILGGVHGNKPIKFPWFSKKDEHGKEKKSELTINTKNNAGKILMAGIGLIVGAALGALVGAGKALGSKINQLRTVDARLLDDVVKQLGVYKEGKDFTRDPKIASDLKTKVCIVLSKVSGEQQILVNTVNDPKLKNITENVVNKLPSSNFKSTKDYIDKYNEITISTIPDKTTVNMISDMVKVFIKSGYPVYLIEVG